MKKIYLIAGVVSLIASGVFLSPQEKKMSADQTIREVKTEETGKVLTFPQETAQIRVPEISELEETYEDLSWEDLEKESRRLEEMLNSSGLIELANKNRLAIADQKKLLHYMRAKAVVSVKLFEIQNEMSEEL